MYFYRIVKSYNIITTRRLLAYLTLFLSSKAMQQTRPHSRKGNNCLCKIWRHGGFRSNNDDDGRKIPHNLTNNHIICANLDCCCCKNVAAASMLTTLSFGIHAAKKPQRHPLFRHVFQHRKAGFYWLPLLLIITIILHALSIYAQCAFFLKKKYDWFWRPNSALLNSWRRRPWSIDHIFFNCTAFGLWYENHFETGKNWFSVTIKKREVGFFLQVCPNWKE